MLINDVRQDVNLLSIFSIHNPERILFIETLKKYYLTWYACFAMLSPEISNYVTVCDLMSMAAKAVAKLCTCLFTYISKSYFNIEYYWLINWPNFLMFTGESRRVPGNGGGLTVSWQSRSPGLCSSGGPH